MLGNHTTHPFYTGKACRKQPTTCDCLFATGKMPPQQSLPGPRRSSITSAVSTNLYNHTQPSRCIAVSPKHTTQSSARASAVRSNVRRQQNSLAAVAAQKSVISNSVSAKQQMAAAIPKVQTGNEHLDGKLKIIGKALASMFCCCSLLASCRSCT